jgi:hypothetical protein
MTFPPPSPSPRTSSRTSAGASAPPVSLRAPLPAELLHKGSEGLVSYRNYPTFSWPWLRRRTLLFGVLVVSFGVLNGIATYAAQHDGRAALTVFANFSLGFLLISTVGPLLATAVRHAHLRLRVERALVVASLLAGLGTSYLADSWASGAIEEATGKDRARQSSPGGKAARDPSAAISVLNLVVLAGIYGILGGGLAVGSYLGEPRRLRELRREQELDRLRAEKQQVDLRLGVLQAQVEPHFLFNTLASVRSLIGTEPTRAQSTIDALVDYLRATIPRLRDGGPGVDSTLGQQLEICASYLALMQVRMGGRLRYDIAVDPDLAKAPFPPLLLISLVENAIKHGIEPRPGPGRVDLRVEGDGQRLVVTISDDGVGLRDGFGVGVGLRNVREQLRVRYGERGSCALTGGAAGGTTARIEIPREAEA